MQSFFLLRFSRQARKTRKALTREARSAHEPPDLSVKDRTFPRINTKTTTALQHSMRVISHENFTFMSPVITVRRNET